MIGLTFLGGGERRYPTAQRDASDPLRSRIGARPPLQASRLLRQAAPLLVSWQGRGPTGPQRHGDLGVAWDSVPGRFWCLVCRQGSAQLPGQDAHQRGGPGWGATAGQWEVAAAARSLTRLRRAARLTGRMSTVGASHRGSSSWLPGRTLLLLAARATSAQPVIIWIRSSSQGNMTSNRLANLIRVFCIRYPLMKSHRQILCQLCFRKSQRSLVLIGRQSTDVGQS